jgi:CO/xanthine dehydrogenase FAD-binding subunit
MSRLYNLREYHRPTDIDDAVRLLRRKNIHTVALAGGTTTIGEGGPNIEAVVDLDGLGLDFIEYENGALYLGAMLRLQTIIEKLHDVSDVLLADAARRTAGLNVRNMATVGGILAGGDNHSPFSVAIAALKARVKIYEQAGEMPLWSDVASQVRAKGFKGKLITAISLNLPSGQMGAWYEQVARTPADRPIVSAAAVAFETPDGAVDLTLSVGGLLQDLIVASHKGDPAQPDKLQEAVMTPITLGRSAGTTYQSDFRGSAEYRRAVAPLLARRALDNALARLSASANQ